MNFLLLLAPKEANILNCSSLLFKVEHLKLHQFSDVLLKCVGTKEFEISSSFSHKEASRILNSLGYEHENEKILLFGISADIYIPAESKEESRGLIIELDGPHHFESYLNVSDCLNFRWILIVKKC